MKRYIKKFEERDFESFLMPKVKEMEQNLPLILQKIASGEFGTSAAAKQEIAGQVIKMFTAYHSLKHEIL